MCGGQFPAEIKGELLMRNATVLVIAAIVFLLQPAAAQQAPPASSASASSAQLAQKMNAYVGCINRLSARSYESRDRYFSWAAKSGPTGKERIIYGTYTCLLYGDEVWSDIVTWLHYGLVEAEELGVTQSNADEMTKSQAPAVQRLLGVSGDLGSRLGLDNKWLVAAIKAGGNYGEIFERNVGKASPLKLERGLNATWSKGGLMYAIPFK